MCDKTKRGNVKPMGQCATLPLAGPKQAPEMGSQGTPGPQLHVGTSTAETHKAYCCEVSDKSVGKHKLQFPVFSLERHKP